MRALPESDSALGCGQMIGNIWEWTADTFDAYPGFEIDLCDTYSAPFFGQQKVLRGGCWVRRSRVIRNTWRNFYTPNRNDIFAVFRTCAAQAVATVALVILLLISLFVNPNAKSSTYSSYYFERFG